MIEYFSFGGVFVNVVLGIVDRIANYDYDSLHNRVLKIQNRIDTLANCGYKSLEWFYKTVECEVDLAVCVVGYANYFERNQYPHSKRLGKTITKAELSSFMPELKSAYAHMDSLYESSMIFHEGEEFTKKTANFFKSVKETGRAGDYQIPNNSMLAAIKKELVCKTLLMGFEHDILGCYPLDKDITDLLDLYEKYGRTLQFSSAVRKILSPYVDSEKRFQKVKS